MIQPANDLRTIRARHVPAWPPRRLAVVTLMALGYPDKVLAVALGTTERAVRRNLSKAAACVFETTALDPTRRMLMVSLAIAGLLTACASSQSGERPAPENAVVQSTPQPGQPGELWGGFLFEDPASPIPYTATPAASGPIPGEEGIPSSFPGTKRFSTLAGLVASRLLPSALMLAPPSAPAGYELIGAYVVTVDTGAVVDYSLSYRRIGRQYRGEPPASELFSPQLSIGWTSRAPRPLPAETTVTDGGLGRKGMPRTKVLVRGFQGVFMEWVNPPGTPDEFVTPSGLNWFDGDGRLWYVQGAEPLDTLLQIAESLAPAG